jgi:hypothetical protein
MPIEVSDVESWLDRLYIAAEGAHLRAEDRKKAVEVAALLEEVRRVLGRGATPAVLVDAAAGKAYVGLLAAQLLYAPARRGGAAACWPSSATRAGPRPAGGPPGGSTLPAWRSSASRVTSPIPRGGQPSPRSRWRCTPAARPATR